MKKHGIFKFKKKYSKNIVDFYIGTKIHNRQKYNSFTNLVRRILPNIKNI